MAKVSTRGANIKGLVCAVPGAPIKARELGSFLPSEEAEKICSTVGLEAVFHVSAGQTAGDLCVAAAEELLRQLNWDRSSLDAVIMVTQTPDHFLPATACVAHGKLQLSSDCLAFDVSLGCSGYVYGLWMAHQFIAAGTCKRVLLLAGDTISQLRSPEDKSVALLFGDAGSATIVESDPEGPLSSFVLGTDGTGAERLCVPAGGFRERSSQAANVRSRDENENLRAKSELFMDGIAIFNFTNSRVPVLVNQVLQQQGWSSEDVDAFLFHQANGFILKKIANKLKLPASQVPVNISKYGNTSMATIPLLLADDMSHRLRSAARSRLVLAGFGVGYSWAGAALELGALQAAQVIHV